MNGFWERTHKVLGRIWPLAALVLLGSGALFFLESMLWSQMLFLEEIKRPAETLGLFFALSARILFEAFSEKKTFAENKTRMTEKHSLAARFCPYAHAGALLFFFYRLQRWLWERLGKSCVH